MAVHTYPHQRTGTFLPRSVSADAGGQRLLLRLSSVLVLMLGLAGCAGPTPDTTFGSGTARLSAGTARVAGSELAAPVQVAVCVDGSLSVPLSRVQQVLTVLAGTVRGWPSTAAGARQATAVAAVPGVELRVRRVDADSFGSAAELVHLTVPGLPGTLTQPGPPAAGQLYDDSAWVSSWNRRQVATTAARAAAAFAARALPGLTPTLRSRASQIIGCVTAGGQTLTGHGPRRLVLVSDLLQEGAPQLGADLHGLPVMVLHVCQGGALVCRAREQQFQHALAPVHGHLIFRPVEDLPDLLPHFLRSGSLG